MTAEGVRKGVSGLRWAGKRWFERAMLDTVREAMLLTASLMLVFLDLMKTASPGKDAGAQAKSGSAKRK